MTTSTNRPLVVTSGEPAGIGPDLLIQLAQDPPPTPIIILADKHLLAERAECLKQSWTCPKHWTLESIPLNTPCQPGRLNPDNAHYVLAQLTHATALCLTHRAAGMVTCPVHKGVLNDAGIAFTGHTEWLQHKTDAKQVVMLFDASDLRVALLTTHLPLKAVPAAITPDLLTDTLIILRDSLRQQHGIADPHIAVCGLNPHAGEQGHMGREEIEVITPTLERLRSQGWHVTGPLPADTLFYPPHSAPYDTILAMYHDQALAPLKALHFNTAVNVTLGLPFVRTSVDHGTALSLAGSGQADITNLRHAIACAERLTS